MDQQKNVIAIEEKPKVPKSDYIVPGIYFYKQGVTEYVKSILPSSRGELEITDLNNLYIERGKLQCSILSDIVWYDMGNPEDIYSAASFIKAKQAENDHYIGCIEEIAYKKGRISRTEVLVKASMYSNSSYGHYLKRLVGE